MSAVEVHRTLGGPSLLESVYEEGLAHELKQVGCEIQRQTPSPIQYKDVTLATPLRIDLLVNDWLSLNAKPSFSTTSYSRLKF